MPLRPPPPTRGGNKRRKSAPIGERPLNGHLYALVEKILALVGGDAAGLQQLLARHSPSKSDMSVPDAAAMYLECNLSKELYTTIRKHVGGMPSQHRVKQYLKTLRVDVVPVKWNGAIVGYAVADIAGLIEARLRAWLLRHPEKAAELLRAGTPKVVDYKVGFDSFSVEPFKQRNYAVEQGMLVLLLDDVKANSWQSAIPCALTCGVKENTALLQVLNNAIDGQLPRGDVTVEHGGHSYKFHLRDFRMADAKAMYNEYGLQGQSSVMPCPHCEERFGDSGQCMDQAAKPQRTMAGLLTWGTRAGTWGAWARANPLAREAWGQRPWNFGVEEARVEWEDFAGTQLLFETPLEHKLVDELQNRFKVKPTLRVPAPQQLSVHAKMKLMSVEDALGCVYRCCNSSTSAPSVLTPLSRAIPDVLHMTMNIAKNVQEWAEQVRSRPLHNG
jgi:hypothetical protein